jgi:hypothetical protein
MKLQFTNKPVIVYDLSLISGEDAVQRFCMWIINDLNKIIESTKKTNITQNELWFVHLFTGYDPINWHTFAIPMTKDPFKLPKELYKDIYTILQTIYIDSMEDNWDQDFDQDSSDPSKIKSIFKDWGVIDYKWDNNVITFKNYKKPLFLYINKFGIKIQ